MCLPRVFARCSDLAQNVSLHGAGPWHPFTFFQIHLAANVKYHGTSPWHLAVAATIRARSASDATGLPRGVARWLVFSSEREPPRRKAVAYIYFSLDPLCCESDVQWV